MPTEQQLRTALVQQLESLARSGIRELPRGRASTGGAKIVVAPVPTACTPQEISVMPAVDQRLPVAAAAGMTTDPGSALLALRHEVAQCTRCQELACSRTQTVFGVGNPRPRLCFFGEAPGADEDAQGEPFVGRAGQLLNKIIAACRLTRDEVYILNALKCRPPNNRTPNDDEISNCWNFAARQLEILQPEFICCLGAVAVRSLLRRRESIGRLRQQFFMYGPSRVIVTYHPAYLLREPSAKRFVWDDMKMLMAAMGIELPSS